MGINIKSIVIILAIISCLGGGVARAGDGSTVIYHDTMDAWNSSRHFDPNAGTVTVGSGCMELYPLATTDIFRFHTDVNSVVVHKGDILMFDYQIIAWGANRQFVNTDMLLLINGDIYGYNPGETWVNNNAARDTTLAMHTVKWQIPVTGVLRRADFRLEWGQDTSVRICDVQIIRPCNYDTQLWHDDLENASSPSPRIYSDCTLINDGAGFITVRSDSNNVANFASLVVPESNGIDVVKGDIFETEFKCENFAGHTGAVIGIGYHYADANVYYTPALGYEETYTDTSKQTRAYLIPVSGRLTGVYFRIAYCNGGTFTVYDYKIDRVSPCTALAGDVEGGSGLFYTDDDGFVHITNDYDVDFQDLKVFASNWLDTNGGITQTTFDTPLAQGEFDDLDNAYLNIRPGGPWGNYMYATSWGNGDWTTAWMPNYYSYAEDISPNGSLGLKGGIDVMAGDVLSVDVNGPISDFQTTVVVRKYPSSLGGNDSSEFYYWLKDPNLSYHDGYFTTIGPWTTVRMPIPATGRLIRAEFTVWNSAEALMIDNIKLTRKVPVVRYHDDLQDAVTNRTYTNLTYVDGDGFVQIVPTTTGGTTSTSGRFISSFSSVDVYPGDIIEAAFNVAAIPAGGTVNCEIIATIDGVKQVSVNPLYGMTGEQTLRLVVNNPTGWTGAPMKMTSIEFRTSYATLGTKVNVEDYSIVNLPLQVTPGDINGDKKVDFKDLALMAQNWMRCTRPVCN